MHISILPQASEKRKEKKKKKENENKKTTRASIWKEESQNTKSWNWNKTQQCSDFLQTCLSQLLNKIYSYFQYREMAEKGGKKAKIYIFWFAHIGMNSSSQNHCFNLQCLGFFKEEN